MSFKQTALVFCLGSLMILGCSESTPDPAVGENGVGDFEGSVDPSSGSFVMRTLEVPNPPGTPVRIELIGRFAPIFDVGPGIPGEIYLLVKVKNVDYRTLYAPAEIVLSHFVPNTVAPVNGNPDWTACPGDSLPATDIELDDGCLYGYDYSDLLGDGALEPGETSGEKFWAFWDPEVVSFSFYARARFSLEADQPRIAGFFYSDVNRNGQYDPDESPFGGGSVHATGPDFERDVEVGPDGRYSFAVRQPGLYTLWATPPPTFAPVEPTTSNPLGVVLVIGSDGQVQSFLNADFGWANALLPLVHPVQFTESRSDIPLDQYNLGRIALVDRVLHLQVGFSGCSPEHPFQLYMVGGLMETTASEPPQALLLLAHDDGNEECDAAFSRELAYDLSPILEEHGPVVLVNFETWGGEVHSFELHGPTPGGSLQE